MTLKIWSTQGTIFQWVFQIWEHSIQGILSYWVHTIVPSVPEGNALKFVEIPNFTILKKNQYLCRKTNKQKHGLRWKYHVTKFIIFSDAMTLTFDL